MSRRAFVSGRYGSYVPSPSLVGYQPATLIMPCMPARDVCTPLRDSYGRCSVSEQQYDCDYRTYLYQRAVVLACVAGPVSCTSHL